MLSRWVGQASGVWAMLIVVLAMHALITITAPADLWEGLAMLHAGWALGLLALLLVLLTTVTMALHVERQVSPKVDQWFLLTVLSCLLFTLSLGWKSLGPRESGADCLLSASYLMTAFASLQFLLWSAPFETPLLRALVWVYGALALLVTLTACLTGRWTEPEFQAWRILNVVAGTLLFLMFGRALVANGEARSWLTLGGSLMALGIMLASVSSAHHSAAQVTPVHCMFGAYLLMLWLLVSRRLPSRSASCEEPAGHAHRADEPQPPSMGALTGENPGNTTTSKSGAGAGAQADAGTLQVRRRIAQDLHDGVGSQIVGIIASLDPSDARQRAVASALEQCLLDVKILVDDIEETHENVLDALGRLRYRVQHSLDRLGIDLTWEVDFDGPLLKLNDERSRQVLHVAQEALANVMRHARASRVTVRCHASSSAATGLVLEIHDDGAGFDVPPPGQAGGKGLSGMHRRALAVSGRLEVLSEPGCGTLVRMTLPL